MVKGKDRNTRGSQQAIFFLFLTALFGLTFKSKKKKELKHTHNSST